MQIFAASYADVADSSHELEIVKIGKRTTEQQKHQHVDEVRKDNDGAYQKSQQIWIPDEATNCKSCITVDVHCGKYGYLA